MCPDTTLLAASVDGTLFPGDARAVDQHASACGRCAELLARLRQERDSEIAQRTGAEAGARSRRVALAGVVTIVAVAASLTVSGVGRATGGNTDSEAHTEAPASARVPPAASAPRVSLLVASRLVDLRRAMTATPKRIASRGEAHDQFASPEQPDPKVAKAAVATKDTPPRTAVVASGSSGSSARPHNDVAAPAPEATLASVSELAHAEPPSPAGLIVRGKNGKPMWRARGGAIEHSLDGGATWADEYTVDHAIVAGAYVTPDVAWLASADGVILRRTPVGWFEASARADGEVASIRASSPTKASVTLVDGRTFETKNAGVAWTEAPSDQKIKAAANDASVAKKRAPVSHHRAKRSRR